jgi:hypothetical protein
MVTLLRLNGFPYLRPVGEGHAEPVTTSRAGVVTPVDLATGCAGTPISVGDSPEAIATAHDDLWWLPEVTRMRAAHDEEQAGVSRLRSAAQMASAHGSVALLRRCEHDLAERGARPDAPGVLPVA